MNYKDIKDEDTKFETLVFGEKNVPPSLESQMKCKLEIQKTYFM